MEKCIYEKIEIPEHGLTNHVSCKVCHEIISNTSEAIKKHEIKAKMWQKIHEKRVRISKLNEEIEILTAKIHGYYIPSKRKNKSFV